MESGNARIAEARLASKLHWTREEVQSMHFQPLWSGIQQALYDPFMIRVSLELGGDVSSQFAAQLWLLVASRD